MDDVLFLRVADDLVGEVAEFLGLGEGGDDALVFEEGGYHVAEHVPFVGGSAAEFAELGEAFSHCCGVL